jgi:hypothetical protein
LPLYEGEKENQLTLCSYTFGNLAFIDLPLRDDDDLRFSQFIVDSWASFIISYTPNPSPRLLSARGYTNTSAELSMAGVWEPVKEGLTMRRLQWPSYQTEFGEKAACAVLDLPLGYYLT